MIQPKYKDQAAFIVCTGPSLTPEVIEKVNKSSLLKFGVNNAWRVVNLDVFHACNKNYYDLYWEKGLKDLTIDKWTWDPEVRALYDVNYVRGIWAEGLSKDPEVIHYHHGSGPQIINIAYLYGITTMYLVGWDMRYPPGEKRHFFGEDDLTKEHFPKVGQNGEWTGLVKEMETIKPEDYGIEIYNCTPNSAMKCFPYRDIDGV